jgi:hypothetical protein
VLRDKSAQGQECSGTRVLRDKTPQGPIVLRDKSAQGPIVLRDQ